jgi:peptide/nickel transport system ATP-binding protein
VLREVIRERSRAERSLSDRARGLLGMETRYSSIEEIRAEVFGGVNVPSKVEKHIDEVADYVRAGKESEARRYLFEEFGSECDFERPDLHDVEGVESISLCHRHKADHEEPVTVYERQLSQ